MRIPLSLSRLECGPYPLLIQKLHGKDFPLDLETFRIGNPLTQFHYLRLVDLPDPGNHSVIPGGSLEKEVLQEEAGPPKYPEH